MVSWNRINQLMSLGDVFDGFVGEFSANIKQWQAGVRKKRCFRLSRKSSTVIPRQMWNGPTTSSCSSDGLSQTFLFVALRLKKKASGAGIVSRKCTPIQRALLLFALRPDSTVGALMTVVQDLCVTNPQ